MENKTTFELVTRLNELMVERNKIDLEHNAIIKELQRRMPHLVGDKNLELIKVKKEQE